MQCSYMCTFVNFESQDESELSAQDYATSSPCLSLCGQEPKFYLIIERKLLCESSSFVQAISCLYHLTMYLI